MLKLRFGIIALFINLLFTTPLLAQTSGSNNTLIRLGTGYSDVIPHQIVRASDDRVYVFAGAGQYLTRIVGYASAPGLPTDSTQFTQVADITENANVISVDTTYNGSTFIFVTANLQNGQVRVYPFEVATQTFRPAVTLYTNTATVTGDYLGTSGISTAIDLNGAFHIVYWTNTNHLVHQLYLVDNSTGALTLSGVATTVDTAGSANHPSIAISPADNSLTVTWVSEATVPARILGRLRDSSGTWGDVEAVSAGLVWSSHNFGINIDQGPGLVMDGSGKRYLTYIEPWDAMGFHGRTHWVTGVRSGNSIVWTDRQTPYYSHDPVPAVNSAGETFIIGHGPDALNLHFNLYFRRIYPDGTWGSEELLGLPPAGGAFDASPSIKWSAVGWNRPDEIEVAIFNAINFNYNSTDVYYVRFRGTSMVSTETPIPPTSVPTASETPVELPTLTLTPSETPVESPTLTLTPSETPVTPTLTPIPSVPQTITVSVSAASDDMNEESGALQAGATTLWVGNGGSAAGGYLGLRFASLPIPKGAVIQSAALQFYSASSQWISIALNIGVENNSGGTFGTGALPSARTLNPARIIHSSNVSWTANAWFTLQDVASLVQIAVNRADWNSGNSMALVLHGTGGNWSRKFASSFEANSANAPRLSITFLSSGVPVPTTTPIPAVTATPQSSNTPTNTPTVTNTPTSTPTPVVTNTPSNTPMPSYTPSNTPTFTPTWTPTPTLTPTWTPTPASSGTLTVLIGSAGDDVNQNGTTLNAGGTTVYVGTSTTATASYTGLRFINLSIPRGAIIDSARLEFYSTANQWIGMSLQLAADAADSSAPFTTSALPSARTLTVARINHTSNVRWNINTWYAFDDMRFVVQEIVNRPGWQTGGSMSFILRGTGAAFGRKFVRAFEGGATTATRLVITYHT